MAGRRSLWPREHGAYAQLAAPLAAALLVRAPNAAAVLLAVAACLAFLAHEPLLVVLGHRGRRLRTTDGDRAMRRLALLAALAGACAAAGFVLAPHALAIAGAALVPVALLLGFAHRRAEHTQLGELVAASALPAAGAVVAVAAGMSPSRAAALWLAWSIGFACTVVAVHRVLARHRRPASRADAIAASALVATTAAAVVAPLLAAVPLAAVSAAVVLRPPPATRLRTVGVVLAITSGASLALVAAA